MQWADERVVSRDPLVMHNAVCQIVDGRKLGIHAIGLPRGDPVRPVAVGRLTAVSDAAGTVTAYRLTRG